MDPAIATGMVCITETGNPPRLNLSKPEQAGSRWAGSQSPLPPGLGTPRTGGPSKAGPQTCGSSLRTTAASSGPELPRWPTTAPAH